MMPKCRMKAEFYLDTHHLFDIRTKWMFILIFTKFLLPFKVMFGLAVAHLLNIGILLSIAQHSSLIILYTIALFCSYHCLSCEVCLQAFSMDFSFINFYLLLWLNLSWATLPILFLLSLYKYLWLWSLDS